MTDFRLAKVLYVPAALESSVLYVSEEYKIAVHLCACGCGSKVPVSLGPAGWKLTERNGKPTVRPSIGSGQLPCSSHYFITDGQVVWLRPMSAAQTAVALKSDHNRREAYYRNMTNRSRWWSRAWQRLLGLFGRG